MRREDRVTVQGPVKKQQPDGLSHGGSISHFPVSSPVPSAASCPQVPQPHPSGWGHPGESHSSVPIPSTSPVAGSRHTHRTDPHAVSYPPPGMTASLGSQSKQTPPLHPSSYTNPLQSSHTVQPPPALLMEDLMTKGTNPDQLVSVLQTIETKVPVQGREGY